MDFMGPYRVTRRKKKAALGMEIIERLDVYLIIRGALEKPILCKLGCGCFIQLDPYLLRLIRSMKFEISTFS